MDISDYVWPMAAFATGFAACFVAVLIVLTKPLHGHFSTGPVASVQNAHTLPTPRIGGIAVYCSVLLGMLLSTGESHQLLRGVVLAGSPAFAFGLLEDVTQRVGVGARLFATLGSGVLGWFITGLAITDVDIAMVDTLFLWTPVAVAFTAFAVSGVANAFNIIDGFNGLAAGTAIFVFSAVGLLGVQFGDAQLGHVCLILAAAVLGFLLVNWPLGKLFLGDGGAYFVGFAVAWVTVMLLARHPQVSAWCPLLMCGYPVVEVLFTILRRRSRKLHFGHPDRLHLHSLVKRRVVRQHFLAMHGTLRNSLTGMIMWLMTMVPILWAFVYYDNTPMLALGGAMFVLLYQVIYLRLVRFSWFAAFWLQLRPTLTTVEQVDRP
jgi:UDP-N-acetylmuramyl pentapeptide phosphotransferase/UDP-N-acetylglucosamine-1-phosphate transferase